MENTIHKSRKRKKEANFLVMAKREGPIFLMSGMGFFLGRVAVFQFMNPVALAFLSVFLGQGYRLYLVALFTAIGVMTKYDGMYLLKYLCAIILICGTETLFNFLKIRFKKEMKAIPGATITLVIGLFFAYINDKNTYFTFLTILESILIFALHFILIQGVTILEGKNKKLVFDNESIISLAILLGAVLAGLADIYISNISLKYLFSALIILLMAYKGGVAMGATSGVLLGFILTLTGFSNYALVGILSIAGMIAGLMKDTGKIGTILGFICGGVITSFYLDISILDMSLLFSVLFGSVLFYVVPKDFQLSVNTIINKSASGMLYAVKSRDIAVEKLRSFSHSFKKLGATFNTLSDKKSTLSQKDISKLIDDVAAKTCANCKFQKDCWETHFYSTYQMSFALLEICEKEGYISKSNIPIEIKGVCVKIDEFANAINNYYEIYKNNISWNNKIAESRQLISKQLVGVSDIIDKLKNEMEFDIKFNESYEETIINELIRNKVDVKNVIVMENKEGKYEVSLDLSPCMGKKRCNKDIIPVVNKVLDRTMKKEEAQCYTQKTISKNVCKLKLIEEEKFQFISATGCMTKEGSLNSGDSYTSLEYKAGQYLLALSDGMGSGKRAKEESEASIDLLEELMESGFDIETAINMINSILVLKSETESFSTLDICSLDCYEGIAQFVKIGAVPTFIVRGKSVIVVESSVLPIGILNEVDIRISKRKVKDGDMIVMMTDGITEIMKGSLNKDWIVDFLGEIKKSNPQYVADMIIEKAMELSNGEVKDDMTVMVSKVWTRP